MTNVSQQLVTLLGEVTERAAGNLKRCASSRRSAAQSIHTYSTSREERMYVSSRVAQYTCGGSSTLATQIWFYISSFLSRPLSLKRANFAFQAHSNYDNPYQMSRSLPSAPFAFCFSALVSPLIRAISSISTNSTFTPYR